MTGRERDKDDMSVAPDFAQAMHRAIEDHERYGDMDDGTMAENGAMRVVGIRRADVLLLCSNLLQEYEDDLSEPGQARNTTVMAIIEIALAIGVHLERARVDAMLEARGQL